MRHARMGDSRFPEWLRSCDCRSFCVLLGGAARGLNIILPCLLAVCRSMQSRADLTEIGRAQVGDLVLLKVTPDVLDWVQRRRVGGQVIQDDRIAAGRHSRFRTPCNLSRFTSCNTPSSPASRGPIRSRRREKLGMTGRSSHSPSTRRPPAGLAHLVRSPHWPARRRDIRS